MLLPPKAKSVALTPEIFALVMLSVAFPVLVKIEVLGAVVVPCATLPKLSDVCDNVTSPEAPVPVSVKVCGAPTPSSAICNDAVSVPTIAGVNVTAKPQFPPGAMGEFDRQVFICEKSALFAPVIVTPLTSRFASPPFVSKMFTGGDAVPVGKAPKLATAGLNAAHAAGPVPTATFVRIASADAVVAAQLVHVGWNPLFAFVASG